MVIKWYSHQLEDDVTIRRDRPPLTMKTLQQFSSCFSTLTLSIHVHFVVLPFETYLLWYVTSSNSHISCIVSKWLHLSSFEFMAFVQIVLSTAAADAAR